VKRSLSILLAALLMMLPLLCAHAETLVMGTPETVARNYELQINGMELKDEWFGNSSETHKYLAIAVTYINRRTETVDLNAVLSATATYETDYVFAADLDFPNTGLEPLVTVSGYLLFRLPNLVAAADPSALTLQITCGDTAYTLAAEYRKISSDSLAAQYFDTPLDAALYYLDRFKNADFEGALSACGYGAISEAYDLAAMMKRVKGYFFTVSMTLPSSYDRYVFLNRICKEREFASVTSNLAKSLLLGPDFDVMQTIPLKDNLIQVSESRSLTIDEYIALLDPVRLKTLDVEYVFQQNSESWNSLRNQANFALTGKINGFGSPKELVAVFRFEGNRYLQTFTVGKFADGWAIYDLYAAFTGIDWYGNAILVSETDLNTYLTSSDYLTLYQQPER